jgi:hypothetical protein
MGSAFAHRIEHMSRQMLNTMHICRMKRFQLELISRDLEKKMVLITGPRQVGKTWLANEAIRDKNKTLYLNYDSFDDREIIENRSWLPDTSYLVLDEIHKMEHWKTFLKGVYDTKPPGMKIIVTGSARSDTFKRGEIHLRAGISGTASFP